LPEGENEAQFLNGVIVAAHNANLAYQSDPDARSGHAANAKGHLWDNGTDPVEELKNLFKVRQLALDNFGINSLADGATLGSLQETLVPISYFHRFQVDAAAKLIGGVDYS